MISDDDPCGHLQMTTWNPHFPNSIHNTWKNIFLNLTKASNNFVLIQHHYKILYRIATSRYLRFKMKIDSNPHCQNCGALETLEHIYLYCPYSIQFVEKIHTFIVSNLDGDFTDQDHVIRFSCSHANRAVTFLLLTCNWYIGRQYQKGKSLYWEPYVRFLKQFLIGEKNSVTSQLDNCLHYSN